MSSSCVFVSLSSWANFSSLKKGKRRTYVCILGVMSTVKICFLRRALLFSCSLARSFFVHRKVKSHFSSHFRTKSISAKTKVKPQKCRQMFTSFIINRKARASFFPAVDAFNGEIASTFGTTQGGSRTYRKPRCPQSNRIHDHPNCAPRCHRKRLIPCQTSRGHRQKRRLRD